MAETKMCITKNGSVIQRSIVWIPAVWGKIIGFEMILKTEAIAAVSLGQIIAGFCLLV